MSSNVRTVEVDISTENAVLLLAAAEELGLEPSVVTTQRNRFVVPQEVNDKAFNKTDSKKSETKKSTTAKKAQE